LFCRPPQHDKRAQQQVQHLAPPHGPQVTSSRSSRGPEVESQRSSRLRRPSATFDSVTQLGTDHRATESVIV
jgi:hypothetical protein